MDWQQIKQALEVLSGLDMDALHVHVGVMAQVATAMMLRRSLGSPWPWLLVLGATIANEWYDLTYEIWPTRDQQYAESVRDLWNTMLLPTLLLILARWAPGLFRPRAGAPAEISAPSS